MEWAQRPDVAGAGEQASGRVRRAKRMVKAQGYLYISMYVVKGMFEW